MRRLMCGNDAMAEAAIQAGCACYFGYPITPQNEVAAYMARRMPEEGRVFIQSESELAAISMVFGASAVGVRAMTSSSSPGISLKQEGISYLAACEIPSVLANVMRGGPGLGGIGPSQSDYFQAVKGGGHGDYRIIVLAPASVQELVDLTQDAFDLADRYRIPVMILGDGILGQMMEPVEISRKEAKGPPKGWSLTGCRGREPNVLRSLFLGEGELEAHNERLQKKYAEIASREVRAEAEGIEGADLVILSYGTPARICRAVAERLQKRGYGVGRIRPITLWPFPSETVREAAGSARALLVVEMSAGQLVEDVRLHAGSGALVHFLGKPGGAVFTEEEILSKAETVLREIKAS